MAQRYEPSYRNGAGNWTPRSSRRGSRSLSEALHSRARRKPTDKDSTPMSGLSMEWRRAKFRGVESLGWGRGDSISLFSSFPPLPHPPPPPPPIPTRPPLFPSSVTRGILPSPQTFRHRIRFFSSSMRGTHSWDHLWWGFRRRHGEGAIPKEGSTAAPARSGRSRFLPQFDRTGS